MALGLAALPARAAPDAAPTGSVKHVARPKTEPSPKPDAAPKPQLGAKFRSTKPEKPKSEAVSAGARAPDRPAEVPATSEPTTSPDASSAAELAPDPQRGAGMRSVSALPVADAPEPARQEEAELPSSSRPGRLDPSSTLEKVAAPGKHQKGKPPHKPAATLPANVPHAFANRAARQKIAGGLTDEDLRAGKDDPELRSLKAAERVLFPRPLSGVEAGWSWDLPAPVADGRPELQGSPTLSPNGAQREALNGAPDAAWLKSLTLPNLPVVLDEFVIKYLRFYRDSSSGKSIARVWAKKSGRYSTAMRAELSRAGVPTDLVWLSMIESGHNPTISSPAGAAGLWQFMPDAGRTYGLTVDRWVDERLDPERSTEAASRYLSDLYRRFGSWDLAIASYNMGYGGLARAIRKFNSNDFWELVRYEAGVPWETTLYVPKIFALAIVMNNKQAFGLDTVEPDSAEAFDVVLVGPSVSLEEVARAADVPESQVEALNPSYLAGRTPPARPGTAKPSWRVRVPAGRGTQCTSALARVSADDDAFEAYVSKFGDTVEAIANAHGVSEARIRAINRVDPKETLAAGTVLLVPRAGRTVIAEANDEVVVVPPRQFDYAGRARLFYRVLPGDTLARVAHVFGVGVVDVGSWNALDESARLQAGMTLQLFVDKSKSFPARTIAPSQTRVLVAGTPDFYDYFEGQNGRKRVIVNARQNDTLALLGKRYGMTVGSMERINRRARTDKLYAGENIVVYVDRGRSVPRHKEDLDSDVLASGTLLPLEPALDASSAAELPAASPSEAAVPLPEPGAP